MGKAAKTTGLPVAGERPAPTAGLPSSPSSLEMPKRAWIWEMSSPNSASIMHKWLIVSATLKFMSQLPLPVGDLEQDNLALPGLSFVICELGIIMSTYRIN